MSPPDVNSAYKWYPFFTPSSKGCSRALPAVCYKQWGVGELLPKMSCPITIDVSIAVSGLFPVSRLRNYKACKAWGVQPSTHAWGFPAFFHSLPHLPIQKSNNNRQNDVTNTELCTQIIQIQALGSMMVGKQFNHSVSQFPPSENNGDNINSNSYLLRVLWASLVVQMVKASACNEGDLDSIPGSGRSPGEGNDNPHQYSYLEKSMDGRAWWATVHGVEKSQTWLNNFTFTFKVIIRIKWYTKKKVNILYKEFRTVVCT